MTLPRPWLQLRHVGGCGRTSSGVLAPLSHESAKGSVQLSFRVLVPIHSSPTCLQDLADRTRSVARWFARHGRGSQDGPWRPSRRAERPPPREEDARPAAPRRRASLLPPSLAPSRLPAGLSSKRGSPLREGERRDGDLAAPGGGRAARGGGRETPASGGGGRPPGHCRERRRSAATVAGGGQRATPRFDASGRQRRGHRCR